MGSRVILQENRGSSERKMIEMGMQTSSIIFFLLSNIFSTHFWSCMVYRAWYLFRSQPFFSLSIPYFSLTTFSMSYCSRSHVFYILAFSFVTYYCFRSIFSIARALNQERRKSDILFLLSHYKTIHKWIGPIRN